MDFGDLCPAEIHHHIAADQGGKGMDPVDLLGIGVENLAVFHVELVHGTVSAFFIGPGADGDIYHGRAVFGVVGGIALIGLIGIDLGPLKLLRHTLGINHAVFQYKIPYADGGEQVFITSIHRCHSLHDIKSEWRPYSL